MICHISYIMYINIKHFNQYMFRMSCIGAWPTHVSSEMISSLTIMAQSYFPDETLGGITVAMSALVQPFWNGIAVSVRRKSKAEYRFSSFIDIYIKENYFHTTGQSDWLFLNVYLSWLIFTCHIIEYKAKFDKSSYQSQTSFACHWPATDKVSHGLDIYIKENPDTLWRTYAITVTPVTLYAYLMMYSDFLICV